MTNIRICQKEWPPPLDNNIMLRSTTFHAWSLHQCVIIVLHWNAQNLKIIPWHVYDLDWTLSSPNFIQFGFPNAVIITDLFRGLNQSLNSSLEIGISWYLSASSFGMGGGGISLSGFLNHLPSKWKKRNSPSMVGKFFLPFPSFSFLSLSISKSIFLFVSLDLHLNLRLLLRSLWWNPKICVW